MTHIIGGLATTMSWDLTAISAGEYKSNCGDVGWEVRMVHPSQDSIFSAIFTTSLTNGASSLTVETSDVSKAGTYSVKVQGYYETFESTSKSGYVQFLVHVIADCQSSAIVTPTPISDQIQKLHHEFTKEFEFSV